MKKNKRLALIFTLAGAAVIAAILWLTLAGKDKGQLSWHTVQVTRGDISNSVTATGTIEPVTEVEVGTQVSGIIDKLYADYNSIVKEGQLIAEMDKVTLESELASAQAQYEGAKAEYEYQQKNFARNESLHAKSLISDLEYDQSLYDWKMAQSSYLTSKAALAKAERNLSYATITSPIDGVVIDRSVEEGQTVAAGFETPTLFTIAADLTKMQVVADVDEADIGVVAEGQRVSFTVDAYPNDTFTGYVTQIRLGSSSSSSSTSTTTESVVTYEVVISADNPELKLKPRLTANVTIFTTDRQDVLCVPSKALRFTPQAPFITGNDTIIDCQAPHKVWTKDGNTFRAIPVEVGISNGISTEIISGIAEGTEIISEAAVAGIDQTLTPSAERSPFMPGPPDRNKNSNKKE